MALDYQMTIEKMAATWNLNSRQNLVWRPLGRIDAPFEIWFYRIYEISGLQRSCVGFRSNGTRSMKIPAGGPARFYSAIFAVPGEKL